MNCETTLALTCSARSFGEHTPAVACEYLLYVASFPDAVPRPAFAVPGMYKTTAVRRWEEDGNPGTKVQCCCLYE